MDPAMNLVPFPSDADGPKPPPELASKETSAKEWGGSDGQAFTLRPLTRHITTHRQSDTLATFHSSSPAEWKTFPASALRFQTVYCTSQSPASLNSNSDIVINAQITPDVGLVVPGGSVSRVVDFPPGYTTTQHRTQSLDYGVVIEGTVELVLDSSETRVLGAGDTAVQRGTKHAWRNPSSSDWARMFFVLISCEPVLVEGKTLKEDHGGL